MGLLLAGGILHSLYDFAQSSDLRDMLRFITHRKPNFQIPEIGAGVVISLSAFLATSVRLDQRQCTADNDTRHAEL